MLQNALANQLLTFPPWQEVLRTKATSCQDESEHGPPVHFLSQLEAATPSYIPLKHQQDCCHSNCGASLITNMGVCSHLAVLLQQDHGSVVDLELTVVLQAPDLETRRDVRGVKAAGQRSEVRLTWM